MTLRARRSRFIRHLPMILHARLRDSRLDAKHHELAICAIFKNEAGNLNEWIEFHQSVGFDHFYLYDNGSTDDFHDVLDRYVASGRVTLIDWPDYPGQISAYRDCVARFAQQARWIAFIDIDEYLFSPAEWDVRAVMRRYRDCHALFVHAFAFGSSGHKERPQLPTLKAYTRRGPCPIAGKTIANPRWIRDITNPHDFRYWKWGLHTFDTDREKATPSGPHRPVDILRINHYWSRSLAELEEKIRRGSALGGKIDEDAYRKRETELNAVEDRTLADRWPIQGAVTRMA